MFIFPPFRDLQRQLKADRYGPSLTDVEKQIAAHNILHQEIEAYSAQLQPSTTNSKVAAQNHTQSHHAGPPQDESFIPFSLVFVCRSSTTPSKRNTPSFT